MKENEEEVHLHRQTSTATAMRSAFNQRQRHQNQQETQQSSLPSPKNTYQKCWRRGGSTRCSEMTKSTECAIVPQVGHMGQKSDRDMKGYLISIKVWYHTTLVSTSISLHSNIKIHTHTESGRTHFSKYLHQEITYQHINSIFRHYYQRLSF
jgi:transcriptional regulator of acetoin/glycerol metabolism